MRKNRIWQFNLKQNQMNAVSVNTSKHLISLNLLKMKTINYNEIEATKNPHGVEAKKIHETNYVQAAHICFPKIL